MNHHLLLLFFFFSFHFLFPFHFTFFFSFIKYPGFSTSLLPNLHISLGHLIYEFSNILRLMHVSAFGGHKLKSSTPPCQKAPTKMNVVQWMTNRPLSASNTIRIASATDFVPWFPSITTVITLVCACVAWSVLCLWLMHLKQLLRVLVCRDTSLVADVGLYVGHMWRVVFGLQMQVHRTKVDLFSGPYVKGVSAPSRTRYLVNLQRAERLRGGGQKGGRLPAGDSDEFMQVISPNHLDWESHHWH